MPFEIGKPPPQVPMPFPLDFDVDDGVCLVCGGELDTGWECVDCGADHRPGVQLLTLKVPHAQV